MLAVATTAASYAQQAAAAREQESQNAIAHQAMIDQYNQTQKELSAQHQAANEEDAHKKDQFNLEAARAVSAVKTQESGTGVGGNTAAGLVRDIKRQNAMRMYDEKRSNHYTNLQISNQMIAAGQRYRGSESSIPLPQRPSALVTGMGIGASLTSSYLDHKSAQGKEQSLWSYFDNKEGKE